MFRLRFDVDRDRIRARFEEARHVMIGMLDHEMDIERKLRVFADGRDDSRPERNVIDEMAVHDVEMQPVRAGFFGAMDLGFELGEVRGEDGRSDEDLGGSWIGMNVERRTANVQRRILKPVFAYSSTRMLDVRRSALRPSLAAFP